MLERYALIDGQPVRCDSIDEWARWFETSDTDRVVEQTHIGDVKVSTVFLGIDHRFLGEGPPILFETMVFGGPLDQEQERYATRDEAVSGHARWVAAMRMPS